MSDATQLSSMFRDATSFNQDISKWDVSKANDFANMFKGAASFDQDLCQWPQLVKNAPGNEGICIEPSNAPSYAPSYGPSMSKKPSAPPMASSASSFDTLFVGATLAIILSLSL